MDVLKLVVPETPKPNDGIIEELEKLMEEAKSGRMTGFVTIRFSNEGKFAIRRLGSLSDLEVCGALDFAKHDIMNSNTPY